MERDSTTASEKQAKTANPITLRAVLLGALGVALLAGVNPYTTFVLRVWSVGSGSLLSGAVVVLFLLVLVNGVLLRLRPSCAFTRGELLVAYGMMIVSVGLAMQGGLLYIVGATTYPFYMAGPENEWQQLIWPHVPLWLRLGTLQANEWYWDGLPKGAGIPWEAWTTPMLAWFSFTLALMGAMFSLGALLSRDWIERQRLTFPLVQVPLSITGDEARPSLRKSILNNRVFWLGFSIPAVCSILNWLNTIYPSVPTVSLSGMEVGRNFAGMGLPWSVLSDMTFSILFPVVGISCLLPGEVSLSLWLFYVLYRLQLVAWASFGIAEGAQSAALINPRAFIGFEEVGGFIALSAVVLYQSRKAIRSALLALVGRERPEFDVHGPLQGRWAIVGFILTNAFMFWWVTRAGMSWWSFAGLIGIFYAVLIGASRLVAAGGVMYVDTGIFPREVMLRTVGAQAIGVTSLTMYAYLSVIYMYDSMNLAMPQMMNSFKLLQAGRLRGRTWPWPTALSISVMLVVGLVALLYVNHYYGGANRTWLYDYPQWAVTELETTLRDPEVPNNMLRLALLAGAGFMLALVWLNTTFVWWPLSPVGFIMASSWNSNWLMWGSVFVGWGLSTVIRRYGGLLFYRKARPVFLGLILGDYLTRASLAALSAILGIHGGVSYGW